MSTLAWLILGGWGIGALAWAAWDAWRETGRVLDDALTVANEGRTVRPDILAAALEQVEADQREYRQQCEAVEAVRADMRREVMAGLDADELAVVDRAELVALRTTGDLPEGMRAR